MKTYHIYLLFLELEKKIERKNSLPKLEPKENKILKYIALANKNNERLGVKDMMSVSDICSPSAMQTYIRSLVDKGWIYLDKTEDARRKQLRLTKETLQYFEKLGIAIQKLSK